MQRIMNELITVLEKKVPGAKGIQIKEGTALRNDLGLDSLRLVDLMVSIEEEFDITFDESDLNPGALQNVSDLVNIIIKTKGEN